MSDEDKRRLLQDALAQRYTRDGAAYPNSPSPWIRDVFAGNFVFELDNALFQIDYAMFENGKITLGETVTRVYAKTSYEAIESLRTAYADLIQTAGARGVPAVDDAADVCKECQRLFDAEYVTEEDVTKASEAIVVVNESIKAHPVFKAEEGERYPAEAYAHAPADNPSDWQVRMWESPTKGATLKQLGYAAAMFSQGGLRGVRAELPALEASQVKAKIRAAYRALGTETGDIPRSIREVEMRQKIGESGIVAIEEVTAELIAEGKLPIRIIQPGFNSSESRHYSEAAVKDAGSIFEGSKMYADHQTEAEEDAMPERSIRDWVATLSETKVSEAGNAVGVAHIHAGWLKEMVAELFKAGNIGQLGTSINCYGSGTEREIEGKKTVAVESLIRGTFGSVDFVTEAGAGGQAGLRESARDSVLDAELVDLATLREARPDLVKAIESDARTQLNLEVKDAMEATKEVEDLKEQVSTLTTERDTLQATVEEGKLAEAKATAQAAIKEAVDAAELPQATKDRLTTRFADATSDEGLTEAITAEADYIAALNEAGTVKNLGPSGPVDDEKAGREAFIESAMRSGLTKEAAEAAADH